MHDSPVEEPDRGASRRGMLRLAAGAAAGAGVAMVVGKASPAAAADTDPVLSGNINEATLATEFTYGLDPNLTPSTSDTEVVHVDATDAPDDRDALRATAVFEGSNAVVAAAEAGVGVVAGGGVAALQLVSVTDTSPLLRTTAAVAGQIDIDGDGNVWLCVADGTPGTWRKLSGPAVAGAFHPIKPSRVYDSRLSAYSPGGGTPIAPNQNRLISVKDARNAAGTVTTADIIPAGAIAVTLNITVSSPTGPNFLSVEPGDSTAYTASTINWGGGFDLANSATIKLDASRNLRVFSGDQTGSTHFIIDVTGYYL